MPGVRNQRGFALVLTIGVVGVLVALTLQLTRLVRTTASATAAFEEQVRLEAAATGGVHLAMALLYEDARSSTVDTLAENWADPTALMDAAETLYGPGRLELIVRDAGGRIQVNRLVGTHGAVNPKQRALLHRFLSTPVFGLEAAETENLLDALQDWLDPDDDITRFGAENGHYRDLEPPYDCRNGPLQDVAELLLVRGFTRKLLFGSRESPGLARFLAVHGDGRININTAAPLVLRSLSADLDAAAVNEMLDHRQNPEADLADATWYRRLPGLRHVSLEPELITIQSSYFEITSTGWKGSRRRDVTALVQRGVEHPIQILSWRVSS